MFSQARNTVTLIVRNVSLTVPAMSNSYSNLNYNLCLNYLLRRDQFCLNRFGCALSVIAFSLSFLLRENRATLSPLTKDPKYSRLSLVPKRSLLPRCPREVWERAGERTPSQYWQNTPDFSGILPLVTFYKFLQLHQLTVESRIDRAENAQGLGCSRLILGVRYSQVT